MPFDLKTAKPVTGGFDLSSAKPVGGDDPAALVAASPEGNFTGAFERIQGDAESRKANAFENAAYNAGGKVTDVAARAGLPESVAAGAGFATNVAAQALPAVLVGGPAKAAAPAMERGAKALLTSAIKPTLAAHQSGKAARAIDTLLTEGINISRGGVGKLASEIENLKAEVEAALKGSSATVDVAKVIQPVTDLAKRAVNSVTGKADLATIRATLLDFLENPVVQQYGGQLPIQVAQKIKQGSYKALGDAAYGMGLKPAAERDTLKAITGGLKKEIEAGEPSVAAPNARTSELVNALKILQRRVMMGENRNPVGLGMLSPSLGHAAGWLLDRSDLVKGLVSRLAYAGREQIPATAARAGVAGYEALQPQTPKDE